MSSRIWARSKSSTLIFCISVCAFLKLAILTANLWQAFAVSEVKAMREAMLATKPMTSAIVLF